MNPFLRHSYTEYDRLDEQKEGVCQSINWTHQKGWKGANQVRQDKEEEEEEEEEGELVRNMQEIKEKQAK